MCQKLVKLSQSIVSFFWWSTLKLFLFSLHVFLDVHQEGPEFPRRASIHTSMKDCRGMQERNRTRTSGPIQKTISEEVQKQRDVNRSTRSIGSLQNWDKLGVGFGPEHPNSVSDDQGPFLRWGAWWFPEQHWDHTVEKPGEYPNSVSDNQ